MTDLAHSIPVETTPRTSVIASGPTNAVSWGSIFAGATATAAFSLALLILGTGLGLASVSPWVDSGMSGMAFGVSAILWITFTQIVASGLGGYLAGRLRTKWADAQRDEVHFRDTAHGFLSWCVAALIHAAVLTSVLATIVAGGVKAGTAVAAGAAAGAASNAGASQNPTSEMDAQRSYFVDALFRRDSVPPTSANSTAFVAPDQASLGLSGEASRIFRFSQASDTLPPDDVRYLGQLVSQRTGVSQADGEKRVTDTYARFKARAQESEEAIKAAADKARKATSYGSLWLFISWLSGAFLSSLAATFGGRQRDL